MLTSTRARIFTTTRLCRCRHFCEKPARKITKKKYESLPLAAKPALPPWDGGINGMDEQPAVILQKNKTGKISVNPSRRLRKSSEQTFRRRSETVDILHRDNGGESRQTSSRTHKEHIADEIANAPTSRREPRNQLAKEILENLAKFSHCILLTRVGQFYEVLLCPVPYHRT